MYKLLLVDDELIIRQGLEKMIDWQGLGLSLTASCGNALEALDSMMDDMPDILLTDIRMPGISGLELINRAVSLHPMLQTLVLSGYDTFQYAQQAMKYGVIEYLLKPCARGELEAALRRACSRIDKERKHTLYLYEERNERIEALVTYMLKLSEEGLPEAQLEARVHELAKTAEDPGLLREALINVVADSVKENPTEWSMNVISEALHANHTLEGMVVAALLQLKRETSPVKNHDFIRQMRTYVERHFAEEALSLQYLADNVVFLSADYIGREFTKACGMKFSSYLLGIRMEKAKALLARNTSLHSYEIAEQIGLGNNPHYFSQLFRKYTGMAPKEYRNEHKKQLENSRESG